MKWLFEARKRYGLTVLNFMVTSNHVHLLVVEDENEHGIPESIRLMAGCTAKHTTGAKGAAARSGKTDTMQRSSSRGSTFTDAWPIST